jgi:hypothetical protein
MKKIIIFLLFINGLGVSAQTYREHFDKINEQYLNGDLPSLYSNLNSNTHNNTSRLMEAYCLMYNATKDHKYLSQLIITSKQVMDRRDDNWTHILSQIAGLPVSKTDDHCLVTDNPGTALDVYMPINCSISQSTTQISSISKGWSRIDDVCGCILHPHFMESGTITYPMAQFILIMQDHPELNSLELPEEAKSNSGSLNSYNGAEVLTYLDYSNWLKEKIKETLNWEITNHFVFDDIHDEPSNSDDEYFHDYSGGDGYKSYNQQSAIARTLLLMYKVTFQDGDANIAYLSEAQRVASKVYDGIFNTTWVFSNGKHFYEWCHKVGCPIIPGTTSTTLSEDISHAWLEEDLLDLMFQNNIPTSTGHDITHEHMEGIANGLLYGMLQTPVTITMNVDGDNSNCDQMCNSSGTPQPGNYYVSGQYPFLSKYNEGVYQAISDIYSPGQLVDGTVNSVYNSGSAVNMLALAQLAYYEKLFNPIIVKPSSGNHHYNGAVSVGGDSQIITLNNPTSSLATISSFSYDPLSMNIANTSNFAIGGNCKFLAAGGLVSAGSPNQVVTLDLSGYLGIFSKTTGSITSVGSYPISNASNITGLAIGEFANSHASPELISVFDNGDLLTYGYDPALHTFPVLYTNNTGINHITGITAGDFNGDGITELAIMSNTSKKISIFSLENGALNLIGESIPFPDDPQWNGITSGDFDGDGIDEIITHKESNGAFEIYRYKSATASVDLKGSEEFPLTQLNGIMCKAHFDNYPQSDALLTFRNYDGQISAFNLEGLCPGLNLNNQTINASTSTDNPFEPTIDNNYPIDYHVNNTLVAGNGFTISDPSVVEMSSGKEIIFKDGFISSVGSDLHAYIDGHLTCDQETFRKPTPKPSNSPSYTYYQAPKKDQPLKPDNAISITPNPNSGKFQIAISTDNKAEKIQQITVFDIRGTKVWETQNSANLTFDVDISTQPKGIYYVRVIDVNGTVQVDKLINQ